MDLTNQIEEKLSAPLADLGIEIVACEYRKESGELLLRVFIDTPSGVSFETCVQTSSFIENILDNYPEYPYDRLEVSSPGLDRIIRKTSDFIKYAGQRVKVKTYQPLQGSKNFTGYIVEANKEQLVLDIDNILMTFQRTNIKKVNLFPEF